MQSLLDYRCEALILVGPALPRAAIEELAERLPVVVVAWALRSRAVEVVRTDDIAGIRLAVEHRTRVIPGGLTGQHGERAAAQLLAGKPPTAVTAFNDHCAAGLMAAVRARGVRIPDQLSLVGYDNSHIASLSTVALTTVAQDAPALAGTALDLALSRTEHESGTSSETVLPPRLVSRQTSAPPG